MNNEAAFRVNTSDWPLVVLTYATHVTNSDLEDHLKEIEEKVLGRHQRFVQIIDMSHGVRPSAIQREIIAEHQLRMDALYRRYCLGEAYVVSSELRGAMVAVFWRVKPAYPYTFVNSFAEAQSWVRSRLKETHSQ